MVESHLWFKANWHPGAQEAQGVLGVTCSLHIFGAVDLLQILTKMRAVDLFKYVPLNGVFLGRGPAPW